MSQIATERMRPAAELLTRPVSQVVVRDDRSCSPRPSPQSPQIFNQNQRAGSRDSRVPPYCARRRLDPCDPQILFEDALDVTPPLA